MKRFLILTLCLCLAICSLASCNDNEADGFVTKAGTDSSSETVRETSEATDTLPANTDDSQESQTAESTTSTEQTMGPIQEMIPKD